MWFSLYRNGFSIVRAFDYDVETTTKEFTIPVADLLSGLEVIPLGVAAAAVDFSKDSIVDAADYTVWRDRLDISGGTTALDYDGWKLNFGAGAGAGVTPPPSPATAPVPEPSSALTALLLSGCYVAGARRLIFSR